MRQPLSFGLAMVFAAVISVTCLSSDAVAGKFPRLCKPACCDDPCRSTAGCGQRLGYNLNGSCCASSPCNSCQTAWVPSCSSCGGGGGCGGGGCGKARVYHTHYNPVHPYHYYRNSWYNPGGNVIYNAAVW